MKFVKCKVVMLPSGEVSHIYTVNHRGNNLRCVDVPMPDCHKTNQHLYILSNDEIEEGDWVYYDNGESCKGVIQIKNGLKPKTTILKKIIATTNKSLTMEVYTISSGVYKEFLPSIPFSFIKEYCKEGGIDEVGVGYDTISNHCGHPEMEILDYLQINPDNTINVKPIKDNYSREEVRVLLENAINAVIASTTANVGLDISIDRDKWIKENL